MFSITPIVQLCDVNKAFIQWFHWLNADTGWHGVFARSVHHHPLQDPFHFAAVAILIIEPVPQIGFSCDRLWPEQSDWTTGWLSLCFDLSSKPPKFEIWSQRETFVKHSQMRSRWLLSPLGSSSLHNAAAVIEAIWAAKKLSGHHHWWFGLAWLISFAEWFIWQKLFIKQSCQQNHSAAQIP